MLLHVLVFICWLLAGKVVDRVGKGLGGVSCWAFEASDAAFQLRLLLASFMYIDILVGILVKNAFFSSSLKCIEKCLMIKEEKKWQMNNKDKEENQKMINDH